MIVMYVVVKPENLQRNFPEKFLSAAQLAFLSKQRSNEKKKSMFN